MNENNGNDSSLDNLLANLNNLDKDQMQKVHKKLLDLTETSQESEPLNLEKAFKNIQNFMESNYESKEKMLTFIQALFTIAWATTQLAVPLKIATLKILYTCLKTPRYKDFVDTFFDFDNKGAIWQIIQHGLNDYGPVRIAALEALNILIESPANPEKTKQIFDLIIKNSNLRILEAFLLPDQVRLGFDTSKVFVIPDFIRLTVIGKDTNAIEKIFKFIEEHLDYTLNSTTATFNILSAFINTPQILEMIKKNKEIIATLYSLIEKHTGFYEKTEKNIFLGLYQNGLKVLYNFITIGKILKNAIDNSESDPILVFKTLIERAKLQKNTETIQKIYEFIQKILDFNDTTDALHHQQVHEFGLRAFHVFITTPEVLESFLSNPISDPIKSIFEGIKKALNSNDVRIKEAALPVFKAFINICFQKSYKRTIEKMIDLIIENLTAHTLSIQKFGLKAFINFIEAISLENFIDSHTPNNVKEIYQSISTAIETEDFDLKKAAQQQVLDAFKDPSAILEMISNGPYPANYTDPDAGEHPSKETPSLEERVKKAQTFDEINRLFNEEFTSEKLAAKYQHKHPSWDKFFGIKNTRRYSNAFKNIRHQALLLLFKEVDKINNPDEKIERLKEALNKPLFNTHRSNFWHIGNTATVNRIKKEIAKIECAEQKKQSSPALDKVNVIKHRHCHRP